MLYFVLFPFPSGTPHPSAILKRSFSNTETKYFPSTGSWSLSTSKTFRSVGMIFFTPTSNGIWEELKTWTLLLNLSSRLPAARLLSMMMQPAPTLKGEIVPAEPMEDNCSTLDVSTGLILLSGVHGPSAVAPMNVSDSALFFCVAAIFRRGKSRPKATNKGF